MESTNLIRIVFMSKSTRKLTVVSEFSAWVEWLRVEIVRKTPIQLFALSKLTKSFVLEWRELTFYHLLVDWVLHLREPRKMSQSTLKLKRKWPGLNLQPSVWWASILSITPAKILYIYIKIYSLQKKWIHLAHSLNMVLKWISQVAKWLV